MKTTELATASVVLNPGLKDLASLYPADQAAKTKEFPFVFGTQYYRAPTPKSAYWEPDLKRMKQLGFTDIKLWVLWRWSHLVNDKYYFDDLDQLMNIAYSNELRVTLNIIFDVSPNWLFDKYPDAKQIMNNGQIVQPYVVGHRQTGGHPGPCYNHPGALAERKKFMKVLVNHFKVHPSMAMWDVWNEPELCYPQRTPDIQRMVCYCPFCRQKFIEWLVKKYSTAKNLNEIWGRNYENWDQVEVPRSGDAFIDFIDWREFNNDVMTDEARWKLEMVRDLDPDRIRYLHVVPNTLEPFNPVTTCVDDYDVAKLCDVFAATQTTFNNDGPMFTPLLMSAGYGKICYNVESHINYNGTRDQPVNELPDLLNDFLPQLGMGVKGYMFWQFHPEALGTESPTCGIVNMDGSDRTVTKAVDTMWGKISPMKEKLLRSFPRPAEIGIWKSRKNEIFHFCINRNFNLLFADIDAYATTLYWNSYNYRFINSEMLEQGKLDNIRLLILPSCYYMSDLETQKLDEWINQGGVVLNEANLAAYSATTGRASEHFPGAGLAEKWNLREVESVSPFMLKINQKDISQLNLNENVRKLLSEFTGSGPRSAAGGSGPRNEAGARAFPICLKSGNILWGANRFAKIDSPGSEPLGWFNNDFPTIVQKSIGKGTLIYCGANIGEGSSRDKNTFIEFLNSVIKLAGITPNLNLTGPVNAVRVDSLYQSDKLEFFVVHNNSDESQKIKPNLTEAFHGLFSGTKISPDSDYEVTKGFCDIFCR
jgi:beta-galactosidase